MSNKRTAITRKSPSMPMKYLSGRDLLVGRTLDYGSGRGYDAKHFGMVEYDPNFAPERPHGKFNTVVCNYVLNVVDRRTEREILEDIKSLLVEGGIAYISVRRDIKKDAHYKTYSQRVVKLGRDFELIKERSGSYAMYKFVKDELRDLVSEHNWYFEYTNGTQYYYHRKVDDRIKELMRDMTADEKAEYIHKNSRSLR